MTTPGSESETWLTTTEAAAHLGVHPSTVRRWADEGDLPTMVTPGGHRRFALSDLLRLSEGTRRPALPAKMETVWAKEALTRTRRRIQSDQASTWLSSFDSEGRQLGRQLGRKLLGIMLRYVSIPEGGEAILEEVRAIGSAYASQAAKSGMPLEQALEAAMFFRDSIVETTFELPAHVRIDHRQNIRLLRRMSQLTNAIQLSMVSTYKEHKDAGSGSAAR